jgi:beta-phosphoglucomutase-like phosphatase (HAD superfamily)
MAQVHRARGQAPADIFTGLFPENLAKAQAAQLAYDRSLAGALARTTTTPVPGADDALRELAATGCGICVTTNLPRRELTAILRAAGWRDVVNVALTVDDVPRGFPSPDLALAAMLRIGVADVREIAMVDASGAGMASGRSAGASVVVGVLTGPHPAARLRAGGATHVVESIADVPRVLASAGQRDTTTRRRTPDPTTTINVPPQVPLERHSSGL